MSADIRAYSDAYFQIHGQWPTLEEVVVACGWPAARRLAPLIAAGLIRAPVRSYGLSPADPVPPRAS